MHSIFYIIDITISVVKARGAVKFFNHQIWVGNKFAHHEVTVTLDSIEIRWLIGDKNGTLINASTKGIPSENENEKIALMSKNLKTTKCRFLDYNITSHDTNYAKLRQICEQRGFILREGEVTLEITEREAS